MSDDYEGPMPVGGHRFVKDPPQPWRAGEHYGIHVYEGERPVATFHTALDARNAVRAVNSEAELRQEIKQLREQLEERRDGLG